jgi:hypothetical protein
MWERVRRLSCYSLRLFDRHFGCPSLVVPQPHTARPAAYLAILDVFLRRTAARVQADHDLLAAVGTGYLSFGVENDFVRKGIRIVPTGLIVAAVLAEHDGGFYPLMTTRHTRPSDQETFERARPLPCRYTTPRSQGSSDSLPGRFAASLREPSTWIAQVSQATSEQQAVIIPLTFT